MFGGVGARDGDVVVALGVADEEEGWWHFFWELGLRWIGGLDVGEEDL